MRLSTKIRRLILGERGAIAVVVAICIAGLMGLAALAVDLGVWYTARGQLMKAADASAMAGAATMIGWNASYVIHAQPEVGVVTAKQFSLANQAIGVDLTLLDTDITMGFWDMEAQDFDPARTGPSTNPDDLTGFQVVVRRDDSANGSVSTFFARIFNLYDVDVQARSVALLGCPGSAGLGEMDLPIGVKEESLTGEAGLECGKVLVFRDENNENAEWTTFFENSNDSTLRSYIDGTSPSPIIEDGALPVDIFLTNGTMSQASFNKLIARYEDNKDPVTGEWPVLLPVIRCEGAASTGQIIGFCRFVITAVDAAPAKQVTGYLDCGYVMPGTTTGSGNCFGLRASAPKLVH